MKIKSLAHTTLPEVIDCLLDAFAEYPIKMPESESYWKKRFDIAQVDYSLSFGAFDDEKLVGFIVNGIAKKGEKHIAFNTGTGVRKPYRGQHITQSIYEYSLPFFKEAGLTHCQLEVLDDNARAIKVYENCGFNISRKMHCYSGKIEISDSSEISLKQISFEMYFSENKDQKRYSWDFDYEALKVAGKQYGFYIVYHQTKEIGRFAVDLERQYLAQFYFENLQKGLLTFEGISSVIDFIKVNNIDDRYRLANDILHKIKLNNFVSQYEMEMEL